MARSSFNRDHDLETRRAEAARMREKYPDRIPVIVEKADGSDIPNLIKRKQIAIGVTQAVYKSLKDKQCDMTWGQFVCVIRKRIKLSAEQAIFLFVDDALPPTGCKEEDPGVGGPGQTVLTTVSESRFGSVITTKVSELQLIPNTGALMSTIYDEKKDEDAFLYVTYSGENSFGLEIRSRL